MWAAVAAVAWSFYLGRNATAAALVLAWSVGELIWLFTGNNLPTEYYPFLDVAVITAILCKDQRAQSDRIVLLIFPLVWFAYIADMHEYYRWGWLWFLKLAQLFAVGAELFATYRRVPMAVSDTPDAPSGADFSFARVRGYG